MKFYRKKKFWTAIGFVVAAVGFPQYAPLVEQIGSSTATQDESSKEEADARD